MHVNKNIFSNPKKLCDGGRTRQVVVWHLYTLTKLFQTSIIGRCRRDSDQTFLANLLFGFMPSSLNFYFGKKVTLFVTTARNLCQQLCQILSLYSHINCCRVLQYRQNVSSCHREEHVGKPLPYSSSASGIPVRICWSSRSHSGPFRQDRLLLDDIVVTEFSRMRDVYRVHVHSRPASSEVLHKIK